MNNNPYNQPQFPNHSSSPNYRRINEPPIHYQQAPPQPSPQPAPEPIFDEKKLRRKNLTQFILNILYGSLVIAAIIGIVAIVFGNDEYGSKAIGTIFLLIVIDLILLLALLPKNPLFRYSIWGLSIMAFAFTTLGIWLPQNPVAYSDAYPYEMYPAERTFGVISQGLGISFWLLLATVVLLSFISLAEPLIEKTGKRAVVFYWTLIIIAITGTLPIAISSPMTIQTGLNPEFPLKIYASAFILSLTIVLILGIAIIAKLVFDARDKSKKTQKASNPYSNTGQNNSRTDNHNGHTAHSVYGETYPPAQNSGSTVPQQGQDGWQQNNTNLSPYPTNTQHPSQANNQPPRSPESQV